MTVPPFPLLWPEGVARTIRPTSSQFRTSLSGAVKNVQESLQKFAKDSGLPIKNIVATSNVAGILGGRPEDAGVAVWFDWDGETRCFAVDRYTKVEDNVQAIHLIIEARRTELRHGGLNIVKQTFRSFAAALPAPGKKAWWEVLCIPMSSSRKEVESAWKRLRIEMHPDKPGGSTEAFQELQAAYRAGLDAQPHA